MMRTVEPRRQTAWDWRAAVQFSCGGAGAGLTAVTALAAWQDPAWLQRTGLVGAGLVCLGLLAVFLKLGRRWRAFLAILNPFTSWLTREALLAPVLLALALAAAVLTSRALAVAAGMAGLAFLFAQAQMLKAGRGIPAWRVTAMPWLIGATGLTEGLSIMAVAAAIFGSPGAWLLPALALLLSARLAVWWAYRRALSAPGAAPVGTVSVLDGMNATLLAAHGGALMSALVGMAFPGLGWLAALAAGLAGLLGGWYLKYNLVVRAAYTQGFALARTPARTPGHAGPGVKPGWAQQQEQGK